MRKIENIEKTIFILSNDLMTVKMYLIFSVSKSGLDLWD